MNDLDETHIRLLIGTSFTRNNLRLGFEQYYETVGIVQSLINNMLKPFANYPGAIGKRCILFIKPYTFLLEKKGP